MRTSRGILSRISIHLGLQLKRSTDDLVAIVSSLLALTGLFMAMIFLAEWIEPDTFDMDKALRLGGLLLVSQLVLYTGWYFFYIWTRVIYGLWSHRIGEFQGIMSLQLGGNWSSEDLGVLCKTLTEVYDTVLWLQHYDNRTDRSISTRELPNEIERFVSQVSEEEKLIIYAIRISSPGQGDWLGVGKVIEVLADFLKFSVEKYLSRDSREVESQERKINNARSVVKLCKEMDEAGLSEESRAAILSYLETKRQRLTRLATKIDKIRG